MKTWQVLLIGEGFTVNGALCNCEISGFVNSETVERAVEKAGSIARQNHPELAQASGPFPRPVINAEDVVELSPRFTYSVAIDEIDVNWITEH